MDIKIEEQIKQIIQCKSCKNVKLYSGGLCKSCYNRLHMDKEKHKENMKKWREKNPNYFKEYYIKRKGGKNE